MRMRRDRQTAIDKGTQYAYSLVYACIWASESRFVVGRKVDVLSIAVKVWKRLKAHTAWKPNPNKPDPKHALHHLEVELKPQTSSYTVITIHNSCAWWKCIFFIIKILLVFLWNKSTKDLNYGESVKWHHTFAINIKKAVNYIKTYSKYTYIYTHTYISTSRHFWGWLLMQQWYLSKL